MLGEEQSATSQGQDKLWCCVGISAAQIAAEQDSEAGRAQPRSLPAGRCWAMAGDWNWVIFKILPTQPSLWLYEWQADGGEKLNGARYCNGES